MYKRTWSKRSFWIYFLTSTLFTVANALPVVIWFALNYASRDYNDTEYDDGMWGVGTFVNNASYIISNHYQEVSMAWVRSYDSYYENDLQAYVIDPDSGAFVYLFAAYTSDLVELLRMDPAAYFGNRLWLLMYRYDRDGR